MPNEPTSRPAEVYIDTNILKFSVHHRSVYRGQPQRVKWGHLEEVLTVYELVETDQIAKLDVNQRAEAKTLRLIADAALAGKIRLSMSSETLIETWGLPKLDSSEERFFGAEIAIVSAPLRSSRVIATGQTDSVKNLQFEFLSKIKHTRFLELQKATGAYQGKNGLQRNQLLDAFHLWCAEQNRCQYFLTMDKKLAKTVGKAKRAPALNIVSPIELANKLDLFHSDFPQPL